MKVDMSGLKRFERRVRIVRSWRGLAIGLCIGAVACVAWAALDWMRVAYTEWAWMGTVLAGSGLVGLLAGYFMKVPLNRLSDSIDRRGGLENRLTTSLEAHAATEFEAALQEDAGERLTQIQPKQLYPIRVGRWQGAAFGLAVLASTIFLLGNSPILLSPEARHEREELKKVGQTVERISRPAAEPDAQKEMTPGEKRLIDEVRKLQRDLEKARINKEEAMQKANDLAKQAQELTKERAKNTEEGLQKAESALEKLEKAELEKNGMKMDPETMERLSKMNASQFKNSQQMTDQQRQQQSQMKMQELNKQQQQLQQKQQQLEQKKSELQNKLDTISKQLKDPKLSEAQRKALEEMQKKLQEMMKGLEKEIKEIQDALNKIMQDKEIQEMIDKIMNHPAMKELQEMAAKMAEDAQQKMQQGEAPDPSQMPTLTKEQLDEMKAKMGELEKQLKELAKQLKDPKALDEFMKQLKESLGQCKGGGMCMKLGMGLFSLFNLPGMPGIPSPFNPIDTMTFDTGKVIKNPNGKEGGGSTTITQIKGDRQKNGEEAYVEIKGPTTVGTRSSVKYTKVLPSYKRKAEEAIDKKSIPKQHEKRVREYFDSLTKGK